MFRGAVIRFFLLLLVGGSAAAGPAVDLPDTPPARRAAEILDVVNTGDREVVLQYALENFTPGMLKPDADSIVDFLMGLRDASGGYDVRGVLQSSPEQVSLLVQSRQPDDRWLRFVVGAEPQEPHRVQGLFTYAASAALATQDRDEVAPGDLPARFEGLIDALAQAGDFSGTVCLSRDGETLLSRAWGQADRESGIPNTPETRFGIASLGKMFTAVAVMQLVETGKLRLDDRVSARIPDWMPPAADEITVEQLLTHTSGLGDYLQAAADDTAGHYVTIEDYRPLVVLDPPAFEPGMRFRYSNVGFLLLGVLVQEVSGESWDRYLEEHVFAPAGMGRSGAYRSLDDATLARGYYRDMSGAWRRNDDLLVGRGTPAGGSASTAEDLAAFATALRAGRLVSPESLRRMTEAHSDMQGTGMMYGYGFTVARSGNGTVAYGHSGGFPGVSAFLEVYETDGYVLAVLSNQGDSATQVATAWRELLQRVAR